jgi:mycofactocin glycosyltransferase
VAVTRPAVDVVVPFRGSPAELGEVRERLTALRLRDGDSVVVVDNTPGHGSSDGPVPVVGAAEVETPAYARNRGAAEGKADWIVFIDADAVPAEDLLDRYFDPPPRERTGLLAGGVLDQAVPRDARPAARYAYLRGLMGQENTMDFGEWSFPQTANVACRRVAFEEVGGFRENIRAAEDADLTWRMKAAGWGLEQRENAVAVHLSRETARSLVRQKLQHGAGGQWLYRHYPHALQPRRRPGLVWWSVRHFTANLVTAARTRDRDYAIRAVFDPLEHLTYEVGRLLDNERPARQRPPVPLR